MSQGPYAVNSPASGLYVLLPDPPWPVIVTRWAVGLRAAVPGLVVVALVAVAATALGREMPALGGPVLGLVIGMVVAPAIASGERLAPGATFASRPILQASIVVLGATISLSQVLAVAVGSLPVMLGTVAVALVGAWLLGGLLGLRDDTRTLIGVGTAICGASAIAAVGAVLKPKAAHVAYAVATVVVCNIVAVLTFPAIARALEMTPWAFGLWAGTAINDTSSVVAAGYSYGPAAGSHAVVVKLTRALMLVPIVIALALWVARRESGATLAQSAGRCPTCGMNPSATARGAGRSFRALPWRKAVPPFLIGFVAAAALASLGVVPETAQPALTATGVFMITMAMAGIGLALRPAQLRAAGHRPLVLGVLLWLLVAASALGLQALTGSL